ncbi:hypothetical protein UA08_00163 [Talaromyces atroroseus]|uniref:Uncharacterized protein n=1 Tax=Talaromyces atroroseus TaxID=1441469 RepID=A0A225AWS4_TALAT|nr:hypothetical protein UA08_00163 [Talaromyces atroroseus]OKL64063.1 hypothetical protein UA08_00163 [Talaromyces atroroseus]
MSDNTGTNTSFSPPRRHWNGEVGARHEHQNVWMNGGARATAPMAPWAGWDADKKERRTSDSSTRSNSSTSSGSKSLFDSLNTQKRGSFSDADQAQRRRSYAEMLPERGFFSRMWHGYTTGSK